MYRKMFKIQNKTKIRKKLNQKKDYLFDFLYLCNFFSSASALSILSHQSFDKDFFNSCCSSSKLNQKNNVIIYLQIKFYSPGLWCSRDIFIFHMKFTRIFIMKLIISIFIEIILPIRTSYKKQNLLQ